MAAIRDRADFDDHAVSETGTLAGNFRRFFQIVRQDEEVSADGFLGLGKRTIDDSLT